PSDDVTYPPLPNRWLIVRIVRASDGPNNVKGESAESWILESDYVDPTHGKNQYLTPGTLQFTKLGRYYNLDEWPGDNPASPPTSTPLTALGPGDATFTANVSNIQYVFTFYDDLKNSLIDLTTSSPGSEIPVTYLVAGWYSDPAMDPLYTDAPGGWTDPQAW